MTEPSSREVPCAYARDGVTLRCLEPADVEAMYPWYQDATIAHLTSWSRPRSLAAFKKHWDAMILEPRDDYFCLGISVEGRLVGRVELGHVNREHRRAFLGIVLGDASVHGRGIGKTSVQLMMDHAFSVEDLEKITAEVFPFNERSCRLFESLGFQREGLLRGHEVHEGVRHDLVVFAMMRDEFYARHPSMFRSRQTARSGPRADVGPVG